MNGITRTITLFAASVMLPLSPLFANDNAAENPSPSIVRYGLFVGSNDGGLGFERLSYAESDAKAMASTMYDVGGIQRSDSVVELEPTSAELEGGITRIGAMISEKGSRQGVPAPRTSEFLFYYSGHSDANGLLLRGGLLSYRELHDHLNAVAADVRIVILDSCDSGAFIRAKGGQRVAPFLIDQSTAMKGDVFLTSSAADEASEESDLIHGSYFTKALISGLRGGADFARNGAVTVQEAYQFARAETIERTEGTTIGPEDPEWHIELTGAGDLVLSDIRTLTAGVVLGKEIGGRISIWDDQSGDLVVGLQKAQGRAIALALAPGRYRVSVTTESANLQAVAILRDGTWTELSPADFSETSPEEARALGAESGASHGRAQDEGTPPAASGAHERIGTSLSLLPGLAFPLEASTGIDAFELNLVAGSAYEVTGAQLSGGIGIVSHSAAGVQLSGGANIVGDSGGMHGQDSKASMEWLQAAGGFNYDGGPASGFQASGGFNVVDGWMNGGQATGGFNIAANRLNGFQAAGGFNIAGGSVEGLQAAGGFNFAGGRQSGVQIAGGFNAAGTVAGAQIGTINLAGENEGFQLGVINVSGYSSGTQLGLVNLSKNGYVALSTFVDNTGTWTVDFESGRTLYGVLFFGVQPDDTATVLSYGGGLGIHSALGPLFLDLDADVRSVIPLGTPYADSLNYEELPFPTIRGKVGIRIGHNLGIFANAAVDIQTPWEGTLPYAFTGTGYQPLANVPGLLFYPKVGVGLSYQF